MNYLNLHTDLLRSEDYLGAEPVERATWLNLMAWCATQENGGTIRNAADWSDRKWQQIVGVTLQEVTEQSGSLYWFDEDGNLVVNHYPAEKESEVKELRERGKRGGLAKTQAKTQAAKNNGKRGGRPKNPSGNPSGNPSENPSETQAKTQRKGKERKGREGKEKEQENLFAELSTSSGAPSGAPCPGKPDAILHHLWENAPEKARRRSSKLKIKQAWAKIRASERPDLETITRAFKAWTECDDWTKERGEYVPGLHRWINERKWESPPETRSATAPPKKIIEGPPGWEEAFRELIPHGLIPLEWGHVDQGLRDQIFEVLNRSTARTGT